MERRELTFLIKIGKMFYPNSTYNIFPNTLYFLFHFA